MTHLTLTNKGFQVQRDCLRLSTLQVCSQQQTHWLTGSEFRKTQSRLFWLPAHLLELNAWVEREKQATFLNQ